MLIVWSLNWYGSADGKKWGPTVFMIIGPDLYPHRQRYESVSLWYGTGSCFFFSGWQAANKKLDSYSPIFYSKFFLLITFWRYIYISFHREKRQKEVTKTVEIKVFLACWWKDPDPDPFKIMTDPSGYPGGSPKTYGSGSTTLRIGKYTQWP